MAALLLLIQGTSWAREADAVSSVWPNTLCLQPLAPGKLSRDIVKLRHYDHVGSPSCSKDGRWVAFDAYKVVSPEMVSEAEIFVVKVDGTGLKRIGEGSTPRWSPDGKRLLFMREGQGDPEKRLGVVQVSWDGTHERRIGPGRWPDWSPDGSQIAYSLGGPDGGGARSQASIYLARADGSKRRRLCEGDCPCWSPDGQKIAYCHVDPTSSAPEIRVVDIETGRSLTVGAGWYRPDWSPDGKSLICNGVVGRDKVMVKLSAVDPKHPPEVLPTGAGQRSSPCFAGEANAIVCVEERPRTDAVDTPHTFDGRYDIATIDLTVVYLVPKDRRPLGDWKERVDYFMGRISAFHQRESGGKSELRIHIYPKPLIVGRTAIQVRGGNPDETFDNSTHEARAAIGWPGKRDGFPILLVLSDINWREIDDFRRTIVINGSARFEGSVDKEGRHFPGAESGGSRATYLPDQGAGLGLVSADGWRVPYSGSDCAVYHEGIGHPIGLPHPEPGDDSVMSLAQYRYWLNQTWLDAEQKRALGWLSKAETGMVKGNAARPPSDLFTTFTAIPSPIVPKPHESVKLKLSWPEGARPKALKVRLETDLNGPWTARPVPSLDKPPQTVDLGRFDHATPVSYRVDATLQNGQSVELWGYFKVESAE
jgi:hypothetical protein